MRAFLVAGFLAVPLSMYAIGCGDDTTAATTDPPDAGTIDTGSGPSGNDSGNGGQDSGGGADSSTPNDGGGDAGAPKNALFAHIAGTLVKIDPTTGAVTTVGATGQTWIVLAWDDVAKVARVVLDVYSPVAGAASPKLGTINLCTGVVTPGLPITRGGNQVRRAEGLVQEPGTSTWHIYFGDVGTNSATEFLSDKNGTIDITTGVVTERGLHQTHQDDGDVAMVIGTSLKLLDVATTNNTGSIYEIDKTTGAASAAIVTGATVLRVAHDPTRSTVFALLGTGAEPNVSARGLATLNMTTGANTPIGTPLAGTDFPNKHFSGLMSAPTPTCP